MAAEEASKILKGEGGWCVVLFVEVEVRKAFAPAKSANGCQELKGDGNPRGLASASRHQEVS